VVLGAKAIVKVAKAAEVILVRVDADRARKALKGNAPLAHHATANDPLAHHATANDPRAHRVKALMPRPVVDRALRVALVHLVATANAVPAAASSVLADQSLR
jgi:hypothetical protein